MGGGRNAAMQDLNDAALLFILLLLTGVYVLVRSLQHFTRPKPT